MTSRTVEIVVNGELSSGQIELAEAVVRPGDGVTSVRLVTRDVSALYAVLSHLQALGLELVAVHWLEETSGP